MTDRQITYLRVSLTERCNLRCVYCYDDESYGRPPGEFLTDDRIVALVETMALLGVRKVRLTGGEPLLRGSVASLIARISALPGIEQVCLTTNGVLLNRRTGGVTMLERLISAGLNRLNISLDSLDRTGYRRITGRDLLKQTLDGIDAAERSGAFDLVRINTVVMHGFNDLEIGSLARWAIGRRVYLRFIEFMPTRGSGWNADSFVPESDIRAGLELDLIRDHTDNDPHDTSRRYRVGDHPGRIGFISPVSRSFCDRCNRLRLTATGGLMRCLFDDRRIDVRPLLDAPLTAMERAGRIRAALSGIHRERETTGLFRGCGPPMSAVGG